MATAKTAKAGRSSAENGPTKVVYLNLPIEIAAALEAEAQAEDRPMSVQAGRILKQYFDAKARK